MFKLICYLTFLSVLSFPHVSCQRPGIPEFINKTLQVIIDGLQDEYPVNNVISSGDHEWGSFELDIENGTLVGFKGMQVEDIEYQNLLHLKNLSLYIDNVTISGDYYNLDGTLNFPFGDKPVALFGTGSILATLSDIWLLLDADFKLNIQTFKLEVDKLDVDVIVKNITANLDNLMGGGALGASFNAVINDVAVTAFEFFKPDILNKFVPIIIDKINSILAGSNGY